jgi:integrase
MSGGAPEPVPYRKPGSASPLDISSSHSDQPTLDRVCKHALATIRFHDLRHTCATLLPGRNVNPKIVSEMLGHASIAITLDTYSHVLPNMQNEAAKAMEDALS